MPFNDPNTENSGSQSKAAPLFLTGVTSALVSFCAAVLFMKYVGIGNEPAPTQPAAAPAVRIINLASLTAEIARPGLSEAQLKQEADKVARAVERLRRSNIIVLDAATVFSAPPQAIIGYEELMRMTQFVPLNGEMNKTPSANPVPDDLFGTREKR